MLIHDLRRYGVPQTVQPRLGQGTFRIAVTSAYCACAVSGEHSLPALEAAHVRPYADGGAHTLPNGLLLRADIHCLVRRRLRHRHARPPLPRESRPRRRLPRAAASTSASPAAPSVCQARSSTSPIPSCLTGTRRRCSGRERHPPRPIVILEWRRGRPLQLAQWRCQPRRSRRARVSCAFRRRRTPFPGLASVNEPADLARRDAVDVGLLDDGFQGLLRSGCAALGSSGSRSRRPPR